MAPLEVPVFGALTRNAELKVPERHLGSAQASEHSELNQFLERAADELEASVDWRAILDVAQSGLQSAGGAVCDAPIQPPGQMLAVADDKAFAFKYPALLRAWQAQGA